MKNSPSLILSILFSLNFIVFDVSSNVTTDITTIISEEEFSYYKDVGEFIDGSPKVTVTVKPDSNDLAEYGNNIVKTLTGSDCNRDGIMDDNATCNSVYIKLWLKYKR